MKSSDYLKDVESFRAICESLRGVELLLIFASSVNLQL